MAWENLIGSINKAAKILNIDLAEKDIPDNYPALVKLKNSLWAQVYSRGKPNV